MIPDEKKRFSWHVNGDGLPLAKVITLGKGRWIACCPICSCLHDVTTHAGDTYTPRCLLREWARPDYKTWIAKDPDAAEHTRVQLVTAEQWAALPVPDLALVDKPTRAKRARKLPA